MALTKNDFKKYKVNDVLARKGDDYSAMSYLNACQDEADKYRESGDEKGAELFSLLTAISSMMLGHGRIDLEAPFAPMMHFEDRRSALPEDLNNDELKFLDAVVKKIKESTMRAQVADILWVRRHGKKRGYDNAVIACKTYLKSINSESYTVWMEQRLERALQISKLLNKPDLTDRALALANQIAEIMLKTGEVASWSRMIGLLATYSECGQEKYAEQIWEKAAVVERSGDPDFATRLREFALALFKENKSAVRAEAARLELIETLIERAEFEAKSENYGLAHSLIEQAINHNKRTEEPTVLREKLSLLLVDYGRKSYESTEWHRAKVQLPQEAQEAIEEIARDVTDTIKGKSLKEAFYAIVVVRHPVDAKSIKSQEQELLRTSIAPHIASFSVTNQAGKVVSREWPFTAGRLAMNFRMLHVLSVIQPAIKQISEDNEVDLESVGNILGVSKFVPEYSKWTLATGILAGLKRDFVTVAHVLPPMLENAFRELLSASGVATERLDENLVSQERSFTWIFKQPQIQEALGDDLLFDLRTLLLSDEGGLNLRNNVSHGLLGDSSFFMSADGNHGPIPAQILYLWWLTLKLCLIHQAIEHFEEQNSQSG